MRVSESAKSGKWRMEYKMNFLPEESDMQMKNDYTTIAMISGKYSPKNPKDETDKLEQIKRNISLAEEVAREAWAQGYTVICPQTNSAYFDDAAPVYAFYKGYLELVKRSDILIMLPYWEDSYGARQEYNLAKNLGKKIYFAIMGKNGWEFVMQD